MGPQILGRTNAVTEWRRNLNPSLIAMKEEEEEEEDDERLSN